ncbi:hypothetical protein ASPWEDRAFT_748578 [Aspergillus wentii DTO 134E9]|uniref:Fucose-specific lectin n=1 Tax=Aspergillus wentii DTO 134E9 TaxID=1073089 RepID=A0A1L9R6L6_ASPWE|nr:uncharacterized protein ASPWEDRAFT_748578 [Aspergillus wentii DTO 134E9]KAI9926787.1 hypothetical protein MW887_003883 [Aspergillus wentii]OJJ30549.1 hypothetical protein ASPWEDRAFT_748578 [Aspergillus wentii DTO 134E9]
MPQTLVESNLSLVYVSDGLHIFFQEDKDNSGNYAIYESHLQDGKWIRYPTPIATDAGRGTPIAAFSAFSRTGTGLTIHVVYLSKDYDLREVYRDVKASSNWTAGNLQTSGGSDIPPTSERAFAPLSLAEFYPVGKDGQPLISPSNQWIIYPVEEVGQIWTLHRNDPGPHQWEQGKIPEGWGKSLPGAKLSAYLQQADIRFLVQEHNGDIIEFSRGPRDDDWAHSTWLENPNESKVQILTPIATATQWDTDQHVFLVGKETIQEYVAKPGQSGNDAKVSDLVTFYEGTNIAAFQKPEYIGDPGYIVLAYRSLDGAIATHVWTKKEGWKAGPAVTDN